MTLTGTTSIRHRSQRLLRLTPKAAHRLAELKVLSPKIKHHSHGFKNQPPWPISFISGLGDRALYTRSVCVTCVGFHRLVCHPWLCMLLKVRFVVDSIPYLLTKPASLEALLIRSSRLCNKLRDQPTHYQNREPAPQPLRPKHRPGRR